MIIDFRYHLVSLVAVFLALGLGILIGTTMLGNDVLIKSQQRMIDRLEQEFNTTRTEKRTLVERVASLEKSLEKEKSFQSTVLPTIVKDRLMGRRVALVTTSDVLEPGVVDSVRATLKLAGASVTSVTRVNQALDLGKKKDKVVGVLQMDKNESEASVIEGLAKEVATDISMGTNMAIPSLKNMKLIQIAGQYDVPVDAVVIVSGRGEEPKADIPKVDEVVVKSFRDMGVDVVGVETTDVAYSMIKAFRNNQVAAVDNIETAPGLLSMVVALQGANGSFGTKDTAKQFMPDLSLWPK